MKTESKVRDGYLFLLPWSLSSLGGVNQVVENLYRQMEYDNRYKPMIMVNSWEEINIKKKIVNDIEHFFFRFKSPIYKKNSLKSFIAFLISFCFTIKEFKKFIKKNNISVVNAHYCNLYLLNIVFMKTLNIYKGKLVLSFHGSDFLNVKESKGLEKLFWKILLRNSDKIVTCSSSLKKDVVEFEKENINKIHSVHNGFSVDKINILEKNLLKKNMRYILNVASFNYLKGHDVLLRAFSLISNEVLDVDLILIGRPSGTEEDIKVLIENLNLSERVHLIEGLSHDYVCGFMKEADIFSLPSRYEAFGIVLLEAGYFGVPVVASNVGGVREIISHNETGLLCEPDDINSLSEALIYLLKSSKERDRLGERLKSHVKENFSWGKTYNEYIDIISS